MKDSEYRYCEERWTELFKKKEQLYKELHQALEEFGMLDKVLKNPAPISEIEFPYK